MHVYGTFVMVLLLGTAHFRHCRIRITTAYRSVILDSNPGHLHMRNTHTPTLTLQFRRHHTPRHTPTLNFHAPHWVTLQLRAIGHYRQTNALWQL